MAVTLFNILELDILKNSQIVAGKKGLENTILRVNFSDCPILDDDIDKTLTSEGDLFINSLYIVKDNEEQLMETIKYYIDSGSSGVLITNEFINELPQKVLTLADDNDFPIIIIDKSVPYAELTKVIMELILLDHVNYIGELKIDRLMDKNINTIEVNKLARQLNSNFNKYYQCAFLKLIDENSPYDIKVYKSLKSMNSIEVIKYHTRFLIIINSDRIGSLTSLISDIKNTLLPYTDRFILGISNVHDAIDQFNIAVRQCFVSLDMESIIQNQTIYYKDLNLYKILYPMKNTSALNEFYNDTMKPLMDYDKNNNSNLIKTLKMYLQNNGDYKITASLLHQHDNTIRYRIAKAKSLLNLSDNNVKFIEHLSIAFKIMDLNKLNL